jgi:hypothetical protein
MPDAFDNQSELRMAFERFRKGREKAANGVEFVRAYEEWAKEDEEGSAFRKGALAAAADRWRDA